VEPMCQLGAVRTRHLSTASRQFDYDVRITDRVMSDTHYSR
jgi:hypothetical protein